jgi:hypothetical protein
MFYVIFDQFYFHEKVAWCHHKTYSMVGQSHLYFLYNMHAFFSFFVNLQEIFLLTYKGGFSFKDFVM